MSKKNRNGSSIRKKIVRGYMRIYTFFSIILFLGFIALSYVCAYYMAEEYILEDLKEVICEVAQNHDKGLTDEALYELTESIIPDYVIRYDVVKETWKTKEEDYYDTSYYRNLAQSENSAVEAATLEPIVNETAEIVIGTAVPEATPEAEESGEYTDEEYITGYVTSSMLYLREAADIDSDIIYRVYYGTEVLIIEDLGEWYKILYEDTELYTVSKLISTGAQPTPTPPSYDAFWYSVSDHMFSKSGTGYTSENYFDYDQVGNAALSLKEPYLFYLQKNYRTYDEVLGEDYVEEIYYSIKAVVDITQVIQYNVIWSAVAIIVTASLVLFFTGLIFVWIYGAAKTRRYLKPIDEITRLANEIQPSSQYRLDVDTAKFELKELVITINNMLDRLNAAHVKRKKFVSDVSHELRTPISVIAGYANMLKRWAKDDEAVFDESVDAIIEESSNMKYLVENLLFLARSDNDQNVYEKEPFDISSLIESICKDARMVDKSKHEILCDIEQGVIVNGDRNRLKQALREFMQNALKYTPPMGEIKMSLQKEGGKAIITVTDTGMGISKKDMGHIFSRFYRGDASRNRDQGGYGLGLAICREIISAHKGKITFKSKEGSGTSVIVTLDLA